MYCEIEFESGWIDSFKLDIALEKSGNPHAIHFDSVVFNFHDSCKIMIDAAVQILSLANQLHRANKDVFLCFNCSGSGAFGYLKRIGFFQLLDLEIVIKPQPYSIEKHYNTNKNLVEIASLHPKDGNDSLPSRLSDTIVNALGDAPITKRFGNAIFTVFAELIDNVEQHSSTALNGYAALQVYPQSSVVKVAISDSGKGIMKTVRPHVNEEFPDLKELSDANLLLEMIKRGISRFGSERGCGLKASADIALRYHATMDIRMPTSRAFITSQAGKQVVSCENSFDNLPLMWGTHICFNFKLDRLQVV